MKKATRPVTFEIRADPSCFYATVYVYSTKEKMHAAIKRSGLAPGDCCALVDTFTRISPDGESSPHIGIIYLCRGELDCNTLVHEAGHLALYSSKRHGVFPIPDDPNEPFCYALGQFYDSLVFGLRERKIIP